MARINEPRHIKPETICIGDTIRVTHTHKDVTKTVVGTVAERHVYNHSTDYVTAAGVTLLNHFRYTPNSHTVTLLDRPTMHVQPTLEGMS